MSLVYILEDDARTAELVAQWLQRGGLDPKIFVKPHDFFYAVRRQAPQCALIDWRLPEMEGLNVVSVLREILGDAVAIVMFTAMTGEVPIVRAFQAGVDDYIAKPSTEAIVLARVGGSMRRLKASTRRPLTHIEHPPYRLDYAKRDVLIDGRPCELRPREFELAWALFSGTGRLLTRAGLLAAVWGKEAEVGSATMTQHLYQLRRKLALDAYGFRLHSVYGVGYRLEVPASPSPNVPIHDE